MIKNNSIAILQLFTTKFKHPINQICLNLQKVTTHYLKRVFEQC